MGELLFKLIFELLGELTAYAAGFVLIPTITLGTVRAEWPNSRADDHNWAGLRRRDDGSLILSRQATVAWGVFLLIGAGVLVTFYLKH